MPRDHIGDRQREERGEHRGDGHEVHASTAMITVPATALPTETSGNGRCLMPAGTFCYRLLYGSRATSRARLIATATWR